MRNFAHTLIVCLLALFLLLAGLPVAAQESATQATLFPFYDEEFPKLTAYLDVHDADGNFVHGILPDDVKILEDDNPVPLDTLQELYPGVQFVVAVAPGPSFDIRDANGLSRFDYLRQGIYSWDYAQDLDDDLSLVTPWTEEIAHVDDPARILAGLSSYPALGDQSFPDLQILSRALDLASNPTPRPNMERAILFITAPQAAEGVAGLQSLAARAAELGIRVYVWVLAAPEFFTEADSAPLRAVSGQTGGQFFAFTGSEEVPNLDSILEPLRHIYQLSYTSRLTTSGSHQAVAQITQGSETVTSNAQPIEVTLLPPQPLFVSPPGTIERAVPAEQSDSIATNTVIELQPTEQDLEVTINFPDGYERPLVRTTLYVDGTIADENTTAPFEQFTWDLRSYLESGNHLLQVEAVDSLGLSGLSEELPVQIEVPPPEQNILAALLRNKLLIAGLVVVLAGAVLALVLILGGKIRPPHPAQAPRSNGGKKKAPSTRPRPKDPLTQPVPIAPIPAAGDASKTAPGLRARFLLSQKKSPTSALAYLTPLAEAGETTLLAPLPLDSEELGLGRDSFQAAILLDDASVEPLHAILRWEEDSYRLIDNGSVAGTWVNYAQVGPQGVKLKHSDLVYAGRVGFRFNLKNPGRQRKPYVRPYQ
jgi:hypothetical protein